MAEANCLELRPDEIAAINQALKPEMEKAALIAAEFQRMDAVREKTAHVALPATKSQREVTGGTRV